MAMLATDEALAELNPHSKAPFLRRAQIRGYKSIEFCDVILRPLTILVGRNSAGKSNFFDALAFLRDILDLGLVEAVKRRGGWPSLACRTWDSGTITIEIDVSFSSVNPITQEEMLLDANYQLKIAGAPRGTSPTLSVTSERLRIDDREKQWAARIEADDGKSVVSQLQRFSNEPNSTSVSQSKLLPRPGFPLLGALGNRPFLDLAESIRSMGFYNFDAKAIRHLRRAVGGPKLEDDGSNLNRAIDSLREMDPRAVKRVRDYLNAIVDEIQGFEVVVPYGDYETIQFEIKSHSGALVKFDAMNMSDGTLRVLASLVAAFQKFLPGGYPAVVGIEEPESSLHPAAMRALVDALDEATARTQILLTTHSADMLDNPTIAPENLLIVQMVDGQTRIGPVDEASVDIVRKKLNTLGGLERDNQLEPNLDDLDRQRQQRMIIQNGASK